MSARRTLGLLLLAAGMLLCGAAGWHYLQGDLAQHQAQAEFARRIGRPPASPGVPRVIPAANAGAASRPTPEPAQAPAYPYGEPLARLRIPVAGIDQIVFGGCDPATLTRGPGHVPGTALPGADGPPRNCVITGHRDSHFRRLGWLKPGNLVELETPTGRTTYRIVEREIVKPDAVSVLAPTREPRLTLITCYPFTFIGAAPERLVLIAAPVRGGAGPHRS